MGKKIRKEMQDQRKHFVAGCLEHGVERHQADAIFDLLERFAEYGFNKSHEGSPLDANELIRETIAIASGELDAARVTIELELAETLPLISAHKGQLQQVVLNIVTNAADSMRRIAR